jgi:excisionase family DNA binding protein
MAKGKNVLTTGDVAKICNVAPRTVSKWFDSGRLKGYRIPGSKDRRIPMHELERFMKQHNIPTTSPSIGKIRVLIVDSDGPKSEILTHTLEEQADYTVEAVDSAFEAGIETHKFSPHVVIVNILSHKIDAGAVCKTIREDEELQTIKIIALSNHLSKSESEALIRKGFDDCISEPTDASQLIRKIEELTAIVY